jgi:hypothetical protein
LVKLTPKVNFTNILQAAFVLIFFCQKLQNQTVSREKLHKTLSYKKAARKLLVNLTPYKVVWISEKQTRTLLDEHDRTYKNP